MLREIYLNNTSRKIYKNHKINKPWYILDIETVKYANIDHTFYNSYLSTINTSFSQIGIHTIRYKAVRGNELPNLQVGTGRFAHITRASRRTSTHIYTARETGGYGKEGNALVKQEKPRSLELLSSMYMPNGHRPCTNTHIPGFINSA